MTFDTLYLLSMLFQLLSQLTDILVPFLRLDADGVLDVTPSLVDLGEFVLELVFVVLEALHWLMFYSMNIKF